MYFCCSVLFLWLASSSSEIWNSDLVIVARSTGPQNMYFTSIIFMSGHFGKSQKPPYLQQEFNLYSFHCCVCNFREDLQVYKIDVSNSLIRIDLLGIESRIKILIIKINQISKYQLSIYQNSNDAWYLPPACIGNDIMC